MMLIYKARVFDVYTNSVNARTAPFEYIGHRGSCAALILDQRDAVGLIPHHRPAIGRTLFELPAGTIDHERSLEDIMVAELKQEAGLDLDASQLRRLTSLYASPGYSSELITLFFTRLRPEQRKSADQLRWFALGELNALIHSQELVDLKTVAAITAYQAIVWKGDGDEVL